MSPSRRSLNLSLLSALLLSGCGFQLRGQAELPPEYSRIHIQGGRPTRTPAASLSRSLASGLDANGVTVMDSPVGADAVLQILDEDLDRRTLATSPDGNAREYSLNYSITYTLRSPDNETLLAPDRLTLTRDVLYNETDLLGRGEGEDIVITDMVNDAAYTIIRRLQTLSKPS